MGNEGADNGADHLGAEKNNYLAYGAIAARALNAEITYYFAKSGIGGDDQAWGLILLCRSL